MKAAYVKSPFQVEIREFDTRQLNDDEVLVKVKACGICGHDLSVAATEAKEWKPFGHEISGVVEKTGNRVSHVKAGDKVVLETGTYNRFSDAARNGQPELDNKGPNFWETGPMGFADYIIVPKETVVQFQSLEFSEASMIEPLGVALDLVYTADIKLNDDVLVIGLGPIGLMALQLAKTMGARNIYGAELAQSKKRIELAKKFGATVIETDKQLLTEFDFPRKGVDKVLVTAPPKLIEPAVEITNWGGVIAFIGIEYGANASITFDANTFHFNKIQLRSSFASPALYSPRCIELAEAGMVDLKSLIGKTFGLDDLQDELKNLTEDKATALKSIMINH
ncbi:MAG: zinc-dependent alcohol dehydrogenase [Prolixibacteraceae bacterium]